MPVCPPLIPGCAIVNAPGGFLDAVQNSILREIAEGCARMASYWIEMLGRAISYSTQLDLTSPWFLEQYGRMFAFAAVLTFGLVLKVCLTGAPGLDGRPRSGEILKSATVYYLYAVVAGAFAPAVVDLLATGAHALAMAFAQGTDADVESFLTDTATAIDRTGLAAAPGGVITFIIASLFAAVAAIVLWIELQLRNAGVYAATLFMVLVFAGLVDRAMWRHVRRGVTVLLVLILAEPIVVAILALAAAAMGGASTDGWSAMLSGLALMTVAVFALGLLFKWIPVAGDDLVTHLGGARSTVANTGPAAAVPGPATVMQQSINRHLVRTSSVRAAAPAAGATTVATAAGPTHMTLVLNGAQRAAQQATQNAQQASPQPPPPSPPKRPDEGGGKP